MSDLSLITTPPADTSALAATMLRPPVSGPATKGINFAQPAGAPASGSAAEHSADGAAAPFAALMLGFLQGSQPAAATLTATGASPSSASGDELLTPDPVADTADFPAALPVTATGPQLATTALSVPTSGRALPASGSSLPPEPAGMLPNTPSVAAQPAVQAEASATVTATRISLADIEHSRQQNTATVAAPQTDTWSRRFMPAPATAPGALPAKISGTDSPSDLLPGAEPDKLLQQSAGLTAGDLSRLVQNLSQNGSRESFSAAFHIDGNGVNSSLSTPGTGTGSPQSMDTGLGNMLRGGLSGFPPLQPLGPAQAWTTGLGDRLLTLAGPGTHSARLKLHPESLGALDIEIKIADRTAQIWFGAQHSQTREAIEASLPQLREMFAEQGIQLAHAQVDSGTGQRARDQHQAFEGTENPGSTWRGTPARSGLPDVLTPVRATTSRLVDAWA